ncbi:hypothetical protein RMATCC62417_05530 [Rhizopus microsporus]|nr:hypothetical protein RMATCC62417_05530 [Rhizopus microsporus]
MIWYHYYLFIIFTLFTSQVYSRFPDSPSIVTYWGQNSRGTSKSQRSLASYCDGNTDVVVLAFLYSFKDKDLPELNLANSCDGARFSGTNLLQCSEVGRDIKSCQNKGKIVLLSLGGAAGVYGFSNDQNARDFADTLWNIFGGGKSKTRPFGDAVVDGFDLDIEGGGSAGYGAMVKRLRSHFNKDKSKKYYITGAPQCPFPDAMLGPALEEVGFDAVFVQFYNNYCSTLSSSFNFQTWDRWARHSSPNKNIKVFLGLPGSSAAAGSGYVPYRSLSPVVNKLYTTYSSFGGIMLWDASAGYGNRDVSPSYQAAIAKLVHGLGKGKPSQTTSTVHSTKTHTKSSHTSTKASRTTSKATTAPTTTSTPSKYCVKEGESCTKGFACSGQSFATCVNGKWLLRPCPNSLTCLSSTDGSSVYCALGHSTCPRENTLQTLGQTEQVPIAKPYDSNKVTAQFSFVRSDSHGGFTATINARCRSQCRSQPLGKIVRIQFKVAEGTRISSVHNGTVTQQGNMVSVKYQSAVDRPMTAVVEMKGQLPSSGVFASPSMIKIS